MDNGYIIKFLSELAQHNNRDWFQEHKGEYEMAIELFRQEVSELIAGCGEFDGSVSHLAARDCIYRIYRDIRFSPDKTPYKRHFSCFLAPAGGRKSPYGGYYLHLEPGASALGGGVYCPDADMLRKLRNHIDTHFDEFQAIISEPLFVKLCGKVYSPDVLKRLPMGYTKDSAAGEYLKFKHYLVERELSNASLSKADFIAECIDSFRAMHPFISFLNEAILDDE